MKLHAIAIVEAPSFGIWKQYTDSFLLLISTTFVQSLQLVVVLLVIGKGLAPFGGISNDGSTFMLTFSTFMISFQLLSSNNAHFLISFVQIKNVN